IEVPSRYQPRSIRDDALRFARTCYDHLAGQVGVAITDALVANGHIVLTEDGGEVTDAGTRFLSAFGADLRARGKRVFCRPCRLERAPISCRRSGGRADLASLFGPGLAHPGARQPCAAVDTWFVGILARALALAVASVGTSALAQDYPTRPVTILVGYTPGATSDLLARTVAERLNAAWGQPVIVDNRSGVGGNIAAAYVARAPADGYTLMVGTDAIMTSNVFLYKNTPFDPVKDFAPITNAGANIICLAVHVDLPVNSVAELIAYAKANPGQLQYGSSGIGSPHQLAGELLRQQTGIDVVHVPYRGGGATINDLLGGHIKVAF